MKKHILILTTFSIIILLGMSFSLSAQTGVGKGYGSRDPQACGNLKGAAPTEGIAVNSFICHAEQETYPHIWLVENVSVQVGAGRPYNMKEDYNVPNIDVRAKVYPIRGSYKKYQCDPLSNILHNQGKNCLMSDQQKANGLCYKDTWGDWLCTMSGNAPAVVSAPPGGGGGGEAAATDAAQTPTEKNNPVPANDKQTAAGTPGKKTDEKAVQTEYPKPDFSEMEKWYEIVKYEYGDLAGGDDRLYVWIKPKVGFNARPSMFDVGFIDRDGVQTHYGFTFGNINEGEVAKDYSRAPTEKEMEKIVSVKVTRVKN